MRVGHGFDAHRFDDESGPLRLGGVVVDVDRGVAATSDGDVAAHALCDALLGAAALGDLGELFPSSDPQFQGADSMDLLRSVVRALAEAGFIPASVDVTIIAEEVRVGPHRDDIRSSLAGALGLTVAQVSVKATTTDGMGSIGGGDGIAAIATAVVT